MTIVRDLVVWTAGWAHTPFGGFALLAIALAESSFFPVPPDVLMIPLALAKTTQSLFFAAVATAGSTLGGILGYFIGAKGGRPLLQRFFKPDKVALVQNQYRRHDVWAVGLESIRKLPNHTGCGHMQIGQRLASSQASCTIVSECFAVLSTNQVFARPPNDVLDTDTRPVSGRPLVHRAVGCDVCCMVHI